MKPEKWNELFSTSIKLNLFNSFVVNPSVAFILIALGFVDEHPTDISKMPSFFCFAAQMIFCMIFEDLTFYVSHRTLHLPGIYS